MEKDPAWVSRTIREIQADFATVHATPNESGIIRENLARWESLLAEALRNLHNSTGYARVSALRVAAEIQRQKAEYQISVGWVGNRRYGDAGPRKATLDELADEMSREDLEDITLTMADAITNRRMEDAKKIPVLPQAAQNGQG